MSLTSSGRASGRAGRRGSRPLPAPLDASALEALALTYVARFATSTGKLSEYLERKLRERGWAEEAPADVAAVVSTLAERGYVNDAGYAQAQGEVPRQRSPRYHRNSSHAEASSINR
jgi:regulatory protein